MTKTHKASTSSDALIGISNWEVKKNITSILLLLSAFLFTISIGINAVSFPLILYQKQISPLLIGFIEAIEILSGILIAKFLYGLGGKVGILRTIIIFASLEALIIMALPFYYNIYWWSSLVFISGFCWFSVIALRQSWLNMVINNEHRSMFMAMNSTMICAGFAIGPLLVKLIGAGQYLIFIISSFLALIGCLILILVKDQQPELKIEKIDYKKIIMANKNGFIARLLLDLQSIVVVLFTVIYGLKKGLTAENAGVLVSAYMVIGLFDFIIGLMIKNKNLQKFIQFGFLGALISILFLPWAISNYYLALLAYLIYGWFISIIFVSVMTKINQDQNKNDLIAINSIAQAAGGLGALFGMLLVGIFMETFDADGFVILIAVANLAYLVFSAFLKK